MTKHELKTWPQYFRSVYLGWKTFEYRMNDRDYKEGDILLLREWRPNDEKYTGREVKARVTHVVYDCPGLPAGYCIMSIQVIDRTTNS